MYRAAAPIVSKWNPDGRAWRLNGENYAFMATYKGVPTKTVSGVHGFFERQGAGHGPCAKRFATNSNSCDSPFPRYP